MAGWGNALCAVGEVRRTLPGCGLRRAEIGRWEARRRGGEEARQEGRGGVRCVVCAPGGGMRGSPRLGGG